MKFSAVMLSFGIAFFVVGHASSVFAQNTFADKTLETAARREVFEKRMKEDPIVDADVVNISQVHGNWKAGAKIANLSGMEKCKSVLEIRLTGHEITDLSPLKDLKQVQSLWLSKNKITDLSPLAGLTNLQHLELEGNEITDLAPLANLTNLRSLYLTNNKIKDVAPLANLKKLWSLYLGGNQITDIKPLAGLRGVDTLDLARNGLADISPLAELQPSKFLFLEMNQITDLGLLINMAKKDMESEKRFAPFWQVYLYGNPLTDAAKGPQLEELRKLSVPQRISVENVRKF